MLLLYRHIRWLFGLWCIILMQFCWTSAVSAQALDHFEFDNFHTGSAKIAGVPFAVTITALDANGNLATTFNTWANLIDDTGTLYPTQTAEFINGRWTGFVHVTEATNVNHLSVSAGNAMDTSGAFTVTADGRMRFLNTVSGSNQSSAVGTQLPLALVAQVTDGYGNPLPNIGVNFFTTSVPVGATFYSLGSNSAISNAFGEVSTLFTLGRKSGSYIVTASLASGTTSTTSFYETALPGPMFSLAVTPQLAVVPASSYTSFKATGYDQYLNEVTLSNLVWSVQNGGGTIDTTGLFHAGNTLGQFSNTVRAVSGNVGAAAGVSIVDWWGGASAPGNEGEGGSGTSGDGGGSGTGSVPATISATPTPNPTPIPGVLYNIQIEPEVLSILQNARIPIVAEGVDFFGNPISGVSYEFSATGDLGTLTQTGPNSALLTGSGTGAGIVTVTATQGDITRTARIVGSIGNGMNRRLVIEEIQSPQRVGEPFTISIAAKDSQNNFVTDYKGPLMMADTTATIDPAVIQPSETGIWYVQAIVSVSNPEVTVTVAGDGMIGVSNIFEVVGDPKKSELGLSKGIGGGLGEVMGASISAKIEEILKAKNITKYSVVRYIGAGIATGLGILGASVGGGLMASKGLEAIGRNPFAKSRLQANLYMSLIAFIAVASLAVFAAMVIVR